MRKVLLIGAISVLELDKLRCAATEAGIDAEITTLESPCDWKCAPRIVPKISREPEPTPNGRRLWTGKRNID